MVKYEKSQDGVFSVMGITGGPAGTEYPWPAPRPLANECTLINYSDKVLTEITLNTEVTVLQRSTKSAQHLILISRSKNTIGPFPKLDIGSSNAVKFYLLDADRQYDFAVEFSPIAEVKVLGQNEEINGVVSTADQMAPWITNRDFPSPAEK
jgi:hypothetical protein